MLLGTAGHVDHGKTTLVRALTGVDCDRLETEKRRGITIELGFAAWDLPDGRRISIVDVPGHERLVRTMLVGAGGMDAVLLAVAADAGVMPQTREHLAACRVLGIERGVVAITCIDRVEDPGAAVARVRSGLAGTALADAEYVAVSALEGTGLAELTAAVGRLHDAWTPRDADLPVYLPVDRVFSVEGFGTVVTGALVRGRVAVGDLLAIEPGTAQARVRGLHVHGAAVPSATPGTRLALNLVADRATVAKGAVVCPAGAIRSGRVFDAEVQWCAHAEAPLGKARGLTLHLGATRGLADLRADGVIAPGASGTARVRLDRELPLPPGARFVLRGPIDVAHGGVIGGGRILDAAPAGRRRAAVRVALAAADPEAALEVLLAEAGPRGLDASEVSVRLPLIPRVGGRLFSAAALDAALTALLERVAAWHREHPEQPGLPAAEVLAGPLARAALRRAGDRLVREGRILRLPEHRAQLDPADVAMARKLLRAVGRAGLVALSEAALIERFPTAGKGQVVRVLRHLERIGRVERVEPLVFPGREIRALRQTVARRLVAGERLAVSDFKAIAGLTRRHAIPLLEWFDGQGISRRDGSVRVVGPRAADFCEDEP